MKSSKRPSLEIRQGLIQFFIRKLRFEGDTSIYINELSRIVFSFIDTASDEFKMNFKEPAMMSGKPIKSPSIWQEIWLGTINSRVRRLGD